MRTVLWICSRVTPPSRAGEPHVGRGERSGQADQPDLRLAQAGGPRHGEHAAEVQAQVTYVLRDRRAEVFQVHVIAPASPGRGWSDDMNLEDLRATIPEYVRDLRLNLGSVLTVAGAPGLSEAQIWLIGLAAPLAAPNVRFARPTRGRDARADPQYGAHCRDDSRRRRGARAPAGRLGPPAGARIRASATPWLRWARRLRRMRADTAGRRRRRGRRPCGQRSARGRLQRAALCRRPGRSRRRARRAL